MAALLKEIDRIKSEIKNLETKLAEVELLVYQGFSDYPEKGILTFRTLKYDHRHDYSLDYPLFVDNDGIITLEPKSKKLLAEILKAPSPEDHYLTLKVSIYDLTVNNLLGPLWDE